MHSHHESTGPRLSRLALLVAAGFAALTCASPSAPIAPAALVNAAPLTPPSWYAAAVTYPSLHTIVIADFYASDTLVVRHEVMHDLADVTSHPTVWFDGKCGDLMP